MTCREVLADGVEIWLGDCRDVLPLLGSFDALVTDPPYGISYQSNHRLESYKLIEGDGDGEAFRFACGLKPTHSSYIFARWECLAEVARPKSLITWVKNNWSMGDLNHEHARQSEVILFYPGCNHFFPKNRPTDVIKVRRSQNDEHPTEKPVDLMRTVVDWTSGVVCDPFMGSGATGVAAARLGRKFIGIEIEPAYYEIAKQRIVEALAQPDMFVVYPWRTISSKL